MGDARPAGCCGTATIYMTFDTTRDSPARVSHSAGWHDARVTKGWGPGVLVGGGGSSREVRFMRKVLVALAFGGLAFALGCGDTSGPHQGLNILSGDNVSDTVNSTLKSPLSVQLLGSDLQPVSGQDLYFSSGGPMLLAPISDPGFLINSMAVTTDANGQAAVWVHFMAAAGPGVVSITLRPPTDLLVQAHHTVLPGAPAYVRADPSDTALYVGGTVTFRPFITDAYGDRRKDQPIYQYQTLSSALSISAPGKATGAAMGRGSVAVSALGFTDTVWASVVPKGRIAIQEAYIVVTNLDGSGFDTIPTPWLGRRSLDWSALSGTFVYDVNASDYRDLISQDMTGHAHPVVTDPLMRNEFYPRYAHDGSYIYFTGIDSLTTCWGVWRVHPDGTSPEHMVADTLDCGPYAYQSGPAPDYASSP